MNDPDMNPEERDPYDDLLDQAIDAIANQPVPPRPIVHIKHNTSSRRSVWMAVTAACIALLAFGVWFWSQREENPNERSPNEQEIAQQSSPRNDNDIDELPERDLVIQRPVKIDRPIDSMLAGLDRLDDELAELELLAQLLDVRAESEQLVSEIEKLDHVGL